MKEEFTELGRQLKELAIKYGYNYLSLAVVDGDIIGNSSHNEDNYIEFHILAEEESEE